MARIVFTTIGSSGDLFPLLPVARAVQARGHTVHFAANPSFRTDVERAGLSFTFPQTEAHDQVYNIRVETWTQDPRSLWIENVGSFTKPVPTERAPDLSNLLFATYKFVTEQTASFVAHFDEA